MNFNAINAHLIVGSHPSNAPNIVNLYNENGVRAIVNLQRSGEPDRGDIDAITEQCALLGDRMWYQRVPIQDESEESVLNNLPEAVGILNRAIQERAREPGQTVYLHCCRGLGRSPSVAVAYLYWFTEMTLEAAMELITTARTGSHPFASSIREATSKILQGNVIGNITAVQRGLIQSVWIRWSSSLVHCWPAVSIAVAHSYNGVLVGVVSSLAADGFFYPVLQVLSLSSCHHP